MAEMDDRALEALAAQDAAGALDAQEAAGLDAAFAASSAELRARIAGLYDAAAAVATSAAPAAVPSASVREALLSRVRAGAAAAAAARGFRFLPQDEGAWQSMGVPGAYMRVLAHDADKYSLLLVRGEPGTRFPPHHHSGAEECYVVSGDLITEGRQIVAGDFHHAEAGSEHGETSTEGGCLLVIIAAASHRTDAHA